MTFRISVIFGLFGVDAGRYADKLWWFFCTCAVVFPAKLMEQTIVKSLDDVTRFSLAREGGKYKRRVQLSQGTLAAAITVIWVFQHKC